MTEGKGKDDIPLLSSPTPIGDPGLLLRTEEKETTLDPRVRKNDRRKRQG